MRKRTEIIQMDMSKTFAQIRSYARQNGLPIIPICAKDVSFFKNPEDFYQHIRDSVNSSNRRITLSALYLGTGVQEVAIAQDLCNALRRNPKLDVTIALDANRAQRLDTHNISSVSLLEDLKKHDTFKLNLVDTSNSSSTIFDILFGRFRKLRELYSTYHPKTLVFDDDVIITGANLSHIYFDKRQDRYMLIKNSEQLGTYLTDLISKMGQSNKSFLNSVRDCNQQYMNRTGESQKGQADCYLIPLFQHGKSCLTDCDDFLRYLAKELPREAHIHVSSGYFNPYLNLKFTSVLAPSEQANGFYRGSGLLKYVPCLYTAILRHYQRANPSCKVNLYDRRDWSFHAKGLWVENLDVYIHIIGSSNFNWRSSNRDLEAQFAVITTNSELIHKIKAEREFLWQQSSSFKPGQSNLIYDTFSRILKTLL